MLTHDELKEKVARAIYKHQREFNEKPSDDFDCQPAWLRGAMMGAAEAALSAIESAGVAVVPVEATDSVLDAMYRAYEMNQTVPGEDVFEAAIRAGRVK